MSDTNEPAELQRRDGRWYMKLKHKGFCVSFSIDDSTQHSIDVAMSVLCDKVHPEWMIKAAAMRDVMASGDESRIAEFLSAAEANGERRKAWTPSADA